MKISYNWLKDYINTNLDYREVSKILTDTGLEVENIEVFQTVKGGLEGLVIGAVKTKEKHPDADKLSITTVDIGQHELLNIVCGAPNVAAGQKVVVATVGTILYDGDDSFKIKKSKIRGAVSEGMICAEDEIGLGSSHDGIMVLDPNAEIGMPAKDYFKIENDYIFEIGLTPNRIDGASHFGVARDLAAFLNLQKPTKASLPDVNEFKIDNEARNIDVIIENKEACPRYSGITISGITIKESPAWLQNKLKAIGLNPINNVVDITNFVLHETGQPLHAFDADMITGNKVIVKTLAEGTEFTTLDEQKRTLAADDLMICNANEGMCIAGVFGGLHSGVTESTTNIFLESANFNPVFVRKTSKKHLLFTDSAFRFERGADPNITLYALKRAAILIKELAGGTISSEIKDIYPNKIQPVKVELGYNNLKRLIGKEIPLEIVKKILISLDFLITNETEEQLTLEVPTYRVDVQREADVIEEILRIYGYNNIDFSSKIKSTVNHSVKPDPEKLQNIISDYLTASGFLEMMSNSLSKSRYYENSKIFKEENLVKIANPLSQDLNLMRQTLLFGGLEAISYNINRKNNNLRLYEFGNCYQFEKKPDIGNELKQYSEHKKLELFITGDKNEINWDEKNKPSTFFQIKAFTENVLLRLGIDLKNIEVSEIQNEVFLQGLRYRINNKNIATLGVVSQGITEMTDVNQSVYYAELFWNDVLKIAGKNKVEFKVLPKFPSVKRDLAILIDKSVKFNDLKNIITKTERNILSSVKLFDVYEGKNIDNDKKSYAISLTFLDERKTLTDKQIEKVMARIIQNLKKEHNIQIR